MALKLGSAVLQFSEKYLSVHFLILAWASSLRPHLSCPVFRSQGVLVAGKDQVSQGELKRSVTRRVIWSPQSYSHPAEIHPPRQASDFLI